MCNLYVSTFNVYTFIIMKASGSKIIKLYFKILKTGYKLSNTYSRICKLSGISIHQFIVLKLLNGNNHSYNNVKELISQMPADMSNVSRILDKLESKNLISRIRNPEDKRKSKIFITEDGKLICQEIENNINNNEILFKKINKKDLKLLEKVLGRISG
ncbi:MAG: MarR family transcriptional regulator [Ignavibacteria bacterium]|nr:MarR family transcriptional regulator [Ignavibacteria bacterium]